MPLVAGSSTSAMAGSHRAQQRPAQVAASVAGPLVAPTIHLRGNLRLGLRGLRPLVGSPAGGRAHSLLGPGAEVVLRAAREAVPRALAAAIERLVQRVHVRAEQQVRNEPDGAANRVKVKRRQIFQFTLAKIGKNPKSSL